MPVFSLDTLLLSFQQDAQDPQRFEAELSIPPSLAVFEGHFPTRPVLPGIVQLQIARALGAHLLQTPLVLHEVKRAKLAQMVLPHDTLHVKGSLIPQNDTLWLAKIAFTRDGKQTTRFQFLVSTEAHA